MELASHALRSAAGIAPEATARERTAGRMDKVRSARWLLAPWSTLVIRRWMILQEERSYDRANARWWARKQAKWEFQDTCGPVLWRVRAPRQARGLYRWGHLTTTLPASDAASPTPLVTSNEPPDTQPAPHQPHGTAGGTRVSPTCASREWG